MSAPQAVLELAAVAKTFRAGKRELRALRGVSLRMERGLVMGLVGPDGAGKTTLMRLAAGLLAPDSGQVTVLGLDATRQSLEVQASLGYMPQRFGLYEDLSVQENLDLYADLQGVPRAERAGRYAGLMKMTGLAPFTARLAGRLSGGMKQKLGLACTLVRAPELLLLDEPTVGVDPVSRRELWQIVYRLVKSEGMSVLLSTAYLDEAERCDRVLLLHEGEALEEGEPAALSAPMRGRCFLAHGGSAGRRALQEAARRAPGVIDALIQGADVRLVTEAGAAPPALEGARVEPVAPRFEDAFVALLRKRGSSSAQPVKTSLDEHENLRRDEVVIEVRGAQRRFGDFYAVKDVSFEVRRGEIFGLLGANGAGKSTTFRMLCGLLPASAGSPARGGRRPAPRRGGGARAHRLHVAEVLALRQPERAPERASSSPAPTAWRARAAPSAWPGRWKGSTWPRPPTTRAPSSRWVTSSAWRWPAR